MMRVNGRHKTQNYALFMIDSVRIRHQLMVYWCRSVCVQYYDANSFRWCFWSLSIAEFNIINLLNILYPSDGRPMITGSISIFLFVVLPLPLANIWLKSLRKYWVNTACVLPIGCPSLSIFNVYQCARAYYLERHRGHDSDIAEACSTYPTH